MATTGTYTWAPKAAELIDEGFEQCGIDPESLTHRHLRSARRSLNFVLRDIETEGYRARAYAVDRQTQVLTVGARAFQLPAGTIDILDATYAEGSLDRPLSRTDKYDYEDLSGKTDTGQPSMYFVSRETPAELSFLGDDAGPTWAPGAQTASLNYKDRPVFVHWPAAKAAGTIVYHRVRYHQDINGISDDVDANRTWHFAIQQGLAWHLSLKWALDRTKHLEMVYRDKKASALEFDTPKGDLLIYGKYTRRRRRS